MLNTRRVTQDNTGKRTAGVDGIKVLNPNARQKLAAELMEMARQGWEGYQSRPIRRVYIPKSNGKLRPLGIPTIKDRIIPGIVKTATEPYWEAIFEATSYGFRPAYSTHDAISMIFNNVKRKPKWVLDADIKGCFDNISHEYLLNQFDEGSQQRKLIKQWLKAGVMDGQIYHNSEIGTPQGGLISPLLANIALDGMESHLREQIDLVAGKTVANKLRVVRYADDFLIIHESREVIEKSEANLKTWLANRGLKLSEEKTSIKHTKEGFDFLGFNIRQYPSAKSGYYARSDKSKQDFKTLIKPSEKAIEKHINDLGPIIDEMRAAPQEKVIGRLNAKIKGWANYYRRVVSKKIYNKLDNWMWNKLWSWSKRRHSNKPGKWIAAKYFQKIGGDKWRFGNKDIVLHKYSHTKITRHVMIKTGKSVYDGDEIYWATRLSKGYGDISPSKAKLLKEQNGICTYCHAAFRNGDRLETHHKTHRAEDGKDKYGNLIILHGHCHDQYHAEYLKQKHEKRRNDKNLAQPYRNMSNIQAEIMGAVNKV